MKQVKRIKYHSAGDVHAEVVGQVEDGEEIASILATSASMCRCALSCPKSYTGARAGKNLSIAGVPGSQCRRCEIVW